jgi:O-antigen chain-terminating methyltransferase
MIRLAYKKMQPDAYIVLETINIQTVYAYLQYFYMDLSHIKPVHPETLKFILESEGFRNIQIMYLNPADDKKIPALKLNEIGTNLDEFNRGIEQINDFLYGYQDYAIVAIK